MRALLVTLVVAAACSSASTPQKKDATTAPVPAVPTNVLDSGKFVLTVGEASVGEETFEIVDRQGLGFDIKTSTKIGDGKETVEQTATLTLDAKGRPSGATITGKQGEKTSSAKLSRGEGGTLTIDADGQTVKEQRPSDLFIANGIVMHWAPVCAIASTEPRLASVFPGAPLGIEPGVTRKMQLKGKDGAAVETEITTVVVDYGGIRLELACDGVRLMSLFQPTTGVLVSRPGFEQVARRLAVVNRPKPTLPDTLVEEDRLVASGKATLACSLVLPKERKRKLPGVVFITGSGGQDRDEDSPGAGGLKMAIFKELAIALGQAGIASLRCDDRGVGRSTGSFLEATLATFVGDTGAAVAALRKEPALDPRRIGLIGHSEGAIIAPILGASDKQLKALVLMAGPGRSLDAIILEQVATSAQRSGASAEESAKHVAGFREALEAIRADQPFPVSVPAEAKAALEPQRAWFASHMKHDPRAQIAKVKLPVFIAQGEKDVQVKVEDAEILRDTLAKAGNQRVVFKTYPELNHLFAATKSGSPADYGDRSAKVDAGFIADVVGFLTKSL
jgi:pimeloyl-ACP methyl ester carboxylesterase